MTYFKLEESASRPNWFIIMPVHEKIKKFFKTPFEGSYSVLEARLLGLTYSKYLRFLRDVIGADIVGKNSLYPVAYLKKTEEAQMLVRLLDKRMEAIDKNYE